MRREDFLPKEGPVAGIPVLSPPSKLSDSERLWRVNWGVDGGAVEERVAEGPSCPVLFRSSELDATFDEPRGDGV